MSADAEGKNASSFSIQPILLDPNESLLSSVQTRAECSFLTKTTVAPRKHFSWYYG
jgi:hypothetical protein